MRTTLLLTLILRVGRVRVIRGLIHIPRADRYQEIDTALREKGNAAKKLWLLYDERGILQEWLAHLDWLNSHLPVVSVQVSNCTDRLQGAVR